MIIIFSCVTFSFLSAQSIPPANDNIPVHILDSVTVVFLLKQGIAAHLASVDNTYVFDGKKTIAFYLKQGNANFAQNEARMAFAQIPGINVWEMDGAGTQVNIGSRGTDPHRSIEMNMRQNGYVTNSDIFGYPENHYTPPMQGIAEVQYVRGSAALQFGSQFGGMMNYIMKRGDSTKPLTIMSEQTGGSYNFFNSYNEVGGTKGKWNYYAYYDNRRGNGWRPNAAFSYHACYANVEYRLDDKGALSFQFSRMDYTQQIAGGLDDAQFNQNARQSLRSRNYFNPEINIPAILLKYNLSAKTKLQVISHGLFGQRNSVQFINTPNIPDTVNASLGTYNPRQVDRDYYNAFTTEARLLHFYKLGKIMSTITGGARYSTEITRRRQKGVGTTASNFDLSLTKPYGIDLHLRSNNYAVFAENIFQLTPEFSITPGFRYEVIRSVLNGAINNTSFPVSYKGNRNFPLFGAGLQYNINAYSQFYGNICQAYRPYLYANITPADQIGVIDPNLKDSKGYDIDFGYRGRFKTILYYDVNFFSLFYGNKIGQLTMAKPDHSTYLLTTNIGNSRATGFESYFNLSLWQLFSGRSGIFDARIFSSLAYTHARYLSGELNNNGKNMSLKNNRVENTPDWIDRTGFQLTYKGFSSTCQYSYVGKSFSDANNTVFSSTGVVGVVPAYHVWDVALGWHFLKYYDITGGINNIANAKYFTRRINMYPGPGILPADGKSFYISLGLKL